MANGDDDNQQAADSQPIDKTPPEEKPVQYAGTNKPVPADAPTSQDDTGSQGGGATLDDISKHVYELHKRTEEDLNKFRSGYKGMQDEVRNLYKEAQQLSQTPQPQELPEPEAPDTERKSVALAHMMIGIPAAIFGGNKYNGGGALHGLSDLVKEFKNAGSKRQIAERIALYREQVAIVHQQNEDRFKQYHELMADRKASIDTKLKTIGDLANLYKDQATADKAMTGNWEDFTEYMGKTEKMNADMDEHVLGTMDKLHKAFGDTITDRYYRSDGAEQYPDLAEGLFSTNNPRAFGKAVRELQKRMPFWKWFQKNRDMLYSSESAAEKKTEGEGKPAPPDVPTDDTKKAIQAMDPHLLFGTPQPGTQTPEPDTGQEPWGPFPGKAPKQYAKPGPYITKLSSGDEAKFQAWVKENNVPFDPSDKADYDMRGFWKALTSGDKRAKQKLSQFDKHMHFPDIWKTPYHKTFSNESMYATKDAPHWEGDKLVDKDGKVIADETPK